jgi:hypothetical protein
MSFLLRDRGPSPLRRLLPKLALLASSLVFTLLVTEASLRVAFYHSKVHIHTHQERMTIGNMHEAQIRIRDRLLQLHSVLPHLHRKIIAAANQSGSPDLGLPPIPRRSLHCANNCHCLRQPTESRHFTPTKFGTGLASPIPGGANIRRLVRG